MLRKLIWNDIKQSKLISISTCLFMAVSAMLFGVTVFLFLSLISSINGLMEQAKTPDFLQMHAGEFSVEEIEDFAKENEAVSEWQICKFLNLENGILTLNGKSLSDSTQDNGVCVQNEKFDYMLSMSDDRELPDVSKNEVYVPVCYKQQYDVQIGDKMKIGTKELEVAGFLRDSQMNSMMASSKRFLVCEENYKELLSTGTEEYLIEFLLKEGSDIQKFEADYIAAELPANGPTITYPLIRMINALSDGMMIFVILLVAVLVSLLSMLCIRFILLTGVEKDRREIGMLKAIGVGKKQIRFLYFVKFLALAGTGMILGLVAVVFLQKPLSKQIIEFYGKAENEKAIYVWSVLSVVLVLGIQLMSLWNLLKGTEKLSAVKSLQGLPEEQKKGNFRQYAFIGGACAISLILMLIPQNLKSTISSPKFVNYMGIGDGQIRLDVRQTEDILAKTKEISDTLQADHRIENFVSLQTTSRKAVLSDGTTSNLTIEVGNHTIFPVQYVSGHAPCEENELSLSVLNAEELELSTGDKIFLVDGDEKKEYVICGTYSDITNGGKTAKAAVLSGNGEIMWSIFYISLENDISEDAWIADYTKTWSRNGDGVKVVSIADFVQGTYGQTIEQIKLAAVLAVIVAAAILWLVVVLFMRLVIQKASYDISLRKALGFASKEIRNIYLKKSGFAILSGIVIGLFGGNFIGNQIAGMCLTSMGASGFTFILDIKMVFIVIPILIFGIAFLAANMGMRSIRKIKAYECCIGERN